MSDFATTRRAAVAAEAAPDGARVRPLARLAGASVAEFELAPGQTSCAVVHRTIDEIWTVLAGRGELWRRQGAREETVALEPGVCLTIPCGTHFQYRALGAEPLRVLGVSLPPWPGADEARLVEGPWAPSADPAQI
ncbi:MAG: cupin domain-containing protein [Burkholderiales bacterium]|nr:cupin domain-containing protein [Burkholderiales bacterium]